MMCVHYFYDKGILRNRYVYKKTDTRTVDNNNSNFYIKDKNVYFFNTLLKNNLSIHIYHH